MKHKDKITNQLIWTVALTLQAFLAGMYVSNTLNDRHINTDLLSPLVADSVLAVEVLPSPTPTVLPTPTPTRAPKRFSGSQAEAKEAICRHFKENCEDAVKVSVCESSLGLYQTNPKSSSKGLFHIINGTWRGHKCTGDPFNFDDNAACAKKIFEAQGKRWNTSGGWKASYQCHKLK